MRERELERLFERFRREGDVAALGIVFDATAPQLHALARRLVRDPSSADDLVQASFVTAIEHAARFDGEGWLVSWLLGILANHARELRRREGRVLEPERLAARAEPDPGARLEAEELTAELGRALATLSARERRVVEPWLHGERRPGELAEELGESPGAVRMRLFRGLARLRRALPRGVALGGLGLFGAAPGLRAVRGRVLEAAHAHASGPAAGTAQLAARSRPRFLGASARSFVLPAAALALTGALAWLVTSKAGAARAPGLPQTPSARVASAAGSAAPLASADPGRTGQADAPPAGERAAPAAPDSSAYERALAGVRGRVVDRAGKPVAGLDVLLGEWRMADQLAPLSLEGGGHGPHPDVDRTRTDAEGRFALHGVRPSLPHFLVLDPGGPRAQLCVVQSALAPGRTTDLGAVGLTACVRLTGTVVDDAGAPVEGARVRVLGGASGDLDEFGGEGAGDLLLHGGSAIPRPVWLARLIELLPFPRAFTDARGGFTVWSPARPVRLVVERPGSLVHEIPLPRPMEGDERGLDALVLSQGARAAGRAVDAGGAPAAGVELWAASALGGRDPGLLLPAGRSDAEGRFRVSGLRADTPFVIAARRAGEKSGFVLQHFDAPGADLVVRLPGKGVLTLDVAEPSGAPIQDARVRVTLGLVGGIGLGLFDLPLLPTAIRQDEPGRYVVRGLAEGRWLCLVDAPGRALATQLVSAASEGALPSIPRVVLPPAAPLEVLVRDPDGAPVEGALVSLGLRPLRSGFLAAERTDAGGRARLVGTAAPAGASPFLRVEHPAFAPLTQELPAAPGKQPLELVLARGGELHALVHPAAGTPDLSLQIHPADPDLGQLDLRWGSLDAHGEARIARLAPGVYAWSLAPEGSRDAFALLDKRDPEPLREGTIEVHADETAELAIDLAAGAARTALVTGVVHAEGLAPEDLSVHATMESGAEEDAAVRADGTFELEPLEPGHVSLAVSWRDPRSPDLVPERLHHEELTLVANEERSVEITLARCEVRVEVVGEDDAPIAGAFVRLDPADAAGDGVRAGGNAADASFPPMGFTGADGIVRLHPRAGRWRGVAQRAGAGAALGEVETPGSGTARLMLRLEAGVPCAGEVVVDRLSPESLASPVWLLVSQEDGRSSQSLPLRFAPDDQGLRAPFRVRGLAAGQHAATLLFAGSGEGADGMPLALPAGGDEHLELRFHVVERGPGVHAAAAR